MQVTEQFDTARLWVGTALAALAVFVAGALALPEQVYWGFIWQYFWGPVYADANNAVCAAHGSGTTQLLYNQAACQAAAGDGLIVAEPGYTLVSEVGYMILLLFALVGVLQLVRRLDIGTDRNLFYALVPYMLFGGVLRVVEDANDAVPEGVSQAISYPWNSLIISPVIYFTVFVITLAALVATLKLEREGYVETHAYPFAAVGAGAFLLSFAYLTVLGFTTDYVSLYPQVLVATVVIATLLAVGIWRAVDEFAPSINEGTGVIGVVVLWGHAIDGVANVIAADWLVALRVGGAVRGELSYTPKHPANEFIINLTEAVLPASVLGPLGSSWPFLLVKLVVALAVVWIFDAEIFEESPRYALLLLTAIVAVGLGPGTRDMIRATFGI